MPNVQSRKAASLENRIVSNLGHSFRSKTLTAFTATRTLSPILSFMSSSESRVITDSMWAPPASSTRTWHITLPRLMSMTFPSRRLRAPMVMAGSPNWGEPAAIVRLYHTPRPAQQRAQQKRPRPAWPCANPNRQAVAELLDHREDIILGHD